MYSHSQPFQNVLDFAPPPHECLTVHDSRLRKRVQQSLRLLRESVLTSRDRIHDLENHGLRGGLVVLQQCSNGTVVQRVERGVLADQISEERFMFAERLGVR